MRKNILTVLVPNSYFRLMRIFHAILPGSLPRATLKGKITFFHSLPRRPFEQDRPVLSLSSHFFTGQQQDKPAIITKHTHSLSSLPSSSKYQATWETRFTLLHWLTLRYFKQSAKHHEETSSNLWTVGVWEIILSSFIFPSKPKDPRRNKLDIFNSCF